MLLRSNDASDARASSNPMLTRVLTYAMLLTACICALTQLQRQTGLLVLSQGLSDHSDGEQHGAVNSGDSIMTTAQRHSGDGARHYHATLRMWFSSYCILSRNVGCGLLVQAGVTMSDVVY